ncbi:MAG: hypothetical protein QF552_03085 [Litorilituus sp.]|nr:hypothetical protein [Litorilituus sp.]
MIEENGYSGEYAPVFSNKLHYPCSVLIKINNEACTVVMETDTAGQG